MDASNKPSFDFSLLNKLTMQFKEHETEQRYLSFIEPFVKIQIRSALFMASFLYLLVSLLDLYIVPDHSLQLALTIHLSQSVSFTLFGLYLQRSSSKILHVILATTAVVIAWSSHLFLTIPVGIHLLFAEAYLMLIWIWLVSGLSLTQSAKLNLVFIVAFEILLYQSNPFDMATTLSHQYFVFVSVLLGTLGAYLTEFYKRQNFANLEKIEQQSFQLVSANDQLRHAQKMEAIGTLVGGIAHDFNNTLAAITGNIYLAKESLSEQPDALEKLDAIETMAFRSSNMIKQLLAFSRKDIVNMLPVNLNSFLTETMQLHEVILPAHIEFHQQYIGEKDLFVLADVNQLEQVILNLLGNARDAVEGVSSAEITLQVDSWIADDSFKNKHPELNFDHFARICIRDNGCGIPESHIEQIFEPFFTTKSMNDGTGLGLSMVYGTMQSHGGTVMVESTPGIGSSFQLFLPLLEESERPVADKPTPVTIRNNHSDHKNITVLLADDDRAVREIVTSILQHLGYKVITAKNGLEAVDVFQRTAASIDLVILDVSMPKMGGLEALKEIKKAKPEIKNIFLTGYDLTQGLQGENIHAENILMKPFAVTEFSQLIKATLEQ